MSDNDGTVKESEPKLIFKAEITDKKLSILLGKGIILKDIVYAAKMLDLEIENMIIAAQAKPVSSIIKPSGMRQSLRRFLK